MTQLRETPFMESPLVPTWRDHLFPKPKGVTAYGISAALRSPETLAGMREELLDTALQDFSDGTHRPAGMRKGDRELLQSRIIGRMILEEKLRFGITPLIDNVPAPSVSELVPALLEVADPHGRLGAQARQDLRRDFEAVLKGRWKPFVPVMASLFRMQVRGSMELGALDNPETLYMIWGDMVIVDRALSLAESILVLERLGSDLLSCLFIHPLSGLRSVPVSRLSEMSRSGRLSDTILSGLRFSSFEQRHAASTIAAASLP